MTHTHYFVRDSEPHILFFAPVHVLDDFAPELELDMDKLKTEFSITPDLYNPHYLPITANLDQYLLLDAARTALRHYLNNCAMRLKNPTFLSPSLHVSCLNARWDLMLFSGNEFIYESGEEKIYPDGTIYSRCYIKHTHVMIETESYYLKDIKSHLTKTHIKFEEVTK